MTARALICEADRIATKERKLTQSKWSKMAGHAENGQTVSRIISRGDCRMSTFVELLEAIGCKLVITEGDYEPAKD